MSEALKARRAVPPAVRRMATVLPGPWERSRAGRKGTVQDVLHAQLRETLATGQWDPGQKLTIDHLACRFETSHTPVREAVRRLASEGALEITAGGTARVPDVSEARLDDLCRARSVVEGALAAEAARRATEADIAELDRLIVAHEASAARDDVLDMLGCNRAFHARLYETAALATLADVADMLWLRYGPFMGMLSRHILPTLRGGDGASYTGHHRAILRAIRSRNAALCEVELKADISATREMLRPLCAAIDDTGPDRARTVSRPSTPRRTT